MDNHFKFNQRVELFYLGDLSSPYPFEKCYINDKCDNLNDEVIRVRYYQNNNYVGDRLFNRSWIRPYHKNKKS